MLFLLRRGIVAAVSTVACGGMMACADVGGEGVGGGDKAKAERGGGDSVNATVLAAPKLVVQMTGLLLVVPPKGGTGDVQVLLPRAANHVGWLGFGMGADSASYAGDICDTRTHATRARKNGICYVDLEKWQVSPLGAGGTVVQDIGNRLPPELVNVTVLSGNEHKANPSSANRRTVVVLGAGAPNGSCKLAMWDLKQYVGGSTGTQQQRQELINRLDWEVQGAFSRDLVFTSGGQTKRVSLPPPDANGNIFILFSHVRQQELGDLPPATHSGVRPSKDASHFAAFYDLLEEPGTARPVPADPMRRPTPTYYRGVTRPCGVSLSKHSHPVREDTAGSPIGGPPPPPPPPAPTWSLATYGCVLARAEGT